MLTKLTGIAEVARLRPNEKLTSLAHLINADMLRICHNEMDGKKASGVDAVTKENYNQNLDENLIDLVSRMKRQAYRPNLCAGHIGAFDNLSTIINMKNPWRTAGVYRQSSRDS